MKIYLITLFLLLSNKLLAQNTHNSASIDSTNTVYYTSLKIHLEYFRNNFQSGTQKENYNILVEANSWISSLPSNIDNFSINLLHSSELNRELKKQESAILLVISPMEIKDNQIVVRLNEYSVKRKKKRNIEYSLVGNSAYKYEYDCEKRLFILVSQKQSGI